MKKNFFPMALMAIAMGLNACSSDDPVVNAGGGNVPFADGGYVKMAINMPSAPSSRAANEEYGDGLVSEYKVNNATLLLFKGTKEDEATFHSAYNLGDLHMANDGSTQVTTITRIVKTVDKTVPDENLYGYVVLNHNDVLSLGSSATELTVNGKKMLTADNGTAFNAATEIKDFAGFRNAVITGKDLRTSGFFMGNAPLLDKAGGVAAPETGAELHTLVNLSNQVYKSKAEAENAKAAEVFVERAVAKVTLDHKEGTLTGGDITVSGSLPMTPVGPEGGAKVDKVGYTIDGWVLDVTNKKSFLGRDYSTSWNAYATDKTLAPTANKYRFVGSSALRDGVSRFRTYWGTDPNYDSFDVNKYAENFVCCKTKNGKDAPVVGDDPTFESKYGADNPQYCFENTFDVDNMQTRQMTRAIVKVKFFGGKTFYTFNDDKTSLYDFDEMSNRVKGVILNNVDVINTLKGEYPGGTVKASDVNLVFEEPNTTDKKVILSSVIVNRPTGADPTTTPDTKTIALTATNFNTQFGIGDIVAYVGGIAYYPITIKHFGDDLTPWANGELGVGTEVYPTPNAEANWLGRYGVLRNNWYNITISGDDLTPWSNKTATNENPYGTAKRDENFLGRYGVLRNNWYNITISSIKNVGSAVVPEIRIDDPTTGDKTDNYISVRINVLSWAKRTQNEEL